MRAHAHRRACAPCCGEDYLAAAVIAAAREDLAGKKHRWKRRCQVAGCQMPAWRCARNWFLRGDLEPRSFRQWCAMLGVGPELLLERLRQEGLL